MRCMSFFLTAVAFAAAGCVYYEPVQESAVRPFSKSSSAPPVSKAEVVKLAKAGISDEVIIARIKAGGVGSHLSADDLLDLKGSGLSDRVIEAMLSASVVPTDQERQTPVIYRYYPVPNAYGSWSYYDYSHLWWDHHRDHHWNGHHW